MASFADGIGEAMGGLFAFGCASIMLLTVAVLTFATFWLFDIRPDWWMLYALGGAFVCIVVLTVVSRVIGSFR